MEPSDRLKRVLESIGQGYLEDDNEAGVDEIPVEFTDDTPHAAVDGGYVAVNPDVRESYGRSVDDTTELRIIADTLAHEVEHINVSDLGSKGDIAEANPDMPRAAGMVANILEDRYIDERRMERNPGQRVSYRVKIEALMGNHHRRPKLSTLLDKEGMMPALMECALQVTAAGYGKGLEDLDADHDLVEFAARWEWVAQQAEEADDLDTRLDVIQSGVDLLREYAPDGTTGQDADDAAEQQGGGNLFDDDDAPDLDDLDMDPDDVEPDGDIGDGPDDTPEFDPDDLDMDPDDLDDLADEADDAGGGAPDPVDDLDPDDLDPDDLPDDDADDAGGGDTGEGPGDADDADTDAADAADGDAPDGDDPAGDGDGGGGDDATDDPADGDTDRVDQILGEYDPDDLEVVR